MVYDFMTHHKLLVYEILTDGVKIHQFSRSYRTFKAEWIRLSNPRSPLDLSLALL